MTMSDSSPDPLKLAFDPAQAAIISEPPNSRILVDAGPGTGKTAVACARVAWLIDQGRIQPDRIWIVSFTRAAVLEVRNRILHYMSDPDLGADVTIATLDSRAWAIHSGLRKGARICRQGSYDESMARFLSMIENDPEVKASLNGLHHLVIDEAQDFVGVRAKVALALIKTVKPKCGISVFADEAQAIYGFSTGRTTGWWEDPTPLPARMRADKTLDFDERRLETVHRTDSPNLIRIFTGTRRKVMDPAKGETPLERFLAVQWELTELANRRMDALQPERDLIGGASSFVLFRKGVDVLLASEKMGETPHRIRMGGMPRCLQPWIGACLSESIGPIVSRSEFEENWEDKVEGTTLANIGDQTRISMQSAWDTLFGFAGTDDYQGLELKALRNRLGGGAPPPEVCLRDIGPGGPALGTIHASKGREADDVYVYVNRWISPTGNGRHPPDWDEEARVMFVAASRARKRLAIVGAGKGGWSYRLDKDSGYRHCTSSKWDKARARVQIGAGDSSRDDVTAAGTAGRQFYRDRSAVRSSQRALAALSGRITLAWGEFDRRGRCYRVKVGTAPTGTESSGDDNVLTVLEDRGLINDIVGVVQEKKGYGVSAPRIMPALRMMGLRTIVLSHGSDACAHLHEPWSESGIMLAPILVGYPEFDLDRWCEGSGSDDVLRI